jgi:superfamily II DNA or RNA helicase
LDAVFLTLPVSWKGTLVQYAGRLHRMRPGKHDVRIYDYVDVHGPILQRMFGRRAEDYRALGCVRAEAPVPSVARELTIHYEQTPGVKSEDI